MWSAGRNGNGVAGHHGFQLTTDLHLAHPFQNVVNLLGSNVVVCQGVSAGRQTSFGQRLVADARIALRQKLPNLGAVFGDEGRNAVEFLDVHGYCSLTKTPTTAGS